MWTCMMELRRNGRINDTSTDDDKYHINEEENI